MSDTPTVSPALLTAADKRLVRTVDALSEEQLREPSLLPGWSRAHVVAHLALNGEALERVLTGQRLGTPKTMYDTQESRDADIEELAGAEAAELRERLLASTHCFERALRAMSPDDADVRFERTPGGQQIRLGNVPLMRLREVEIHHADLEAGYAASDWSPAFSALLVESMTHYQDGPAFRVLARDLARTWQLGDGEGGPVVSGTAADLGWWLTGRGSGQGLETDARGLPRIDPW